MFGKTREDWDIFKLRLRGLSQKEIDSMIFDCTGRASVNNLGQGAMKGTDVAIEALARQRSTDNIVLWTELEFARNGHGHHYIPR